MLKKCCCYLYAVQFILELDANTLVAQLNWSASNLPGALVTRWIAWIQLFNFMIWHIPGNKHTATDELSWRSKIEDEIVDEEDIDDFIDSQLNMIHVSTLEIGNNNDNVLEPGYSQAHQQIAYYLTSMQRPPGMSTSKFRNFCKTAVRYLVQDRYLF